ncbi:hypothetical protein E2C01_018211 [Portunus trituberculatus]|uniref:Uncharacterized protein n=1 Tax=Portunus trituberculatus TaxID=210409 RepID=A0A5B7DUG1_PORTR|nr:hypothetical protein [Portunus trituberculatus]
MALASVCPSPAFVPAYASHPSAAASDCPSPAPTPTSLACAKLHSPSEKAGLELDLEIMDRVEKEQAASVMSAPAVHVVAVPLSCCCLRSQRL